MDKISSCCVQLLSTRMFNLLQNCWDKPIVNNQILPGHKEKKNTSPLFHVHSHIRKSGGELPMCSFSPKRTQRTKERNIFLCSIAEYSSCCPVNSGREGRTGEYCSAICTLASVQSVASVCQILA